MLKEKICIIIPSFKVGGGTRVFVELANKLCTTYKVSIAYPNNSNDTNNFVIDNSISLIKIGNNANSRIKKLCNLFRLVRYLNNNYCDSIVIYTDPLFTIIANFIRAKNKYRFIQADDYAMFDDGLILGSGILLKLYKILAKRSYSYKCKYIFNSKYVYDRYVDISKRNDVPFRLVHPAINPFFLSSPNERSEKINICLVARKHPLKGLITFIDAYRGLDTRLKEKLGKIYLISHDNLEAFDTRGMDIIVPRSDIEIANIYKSSDIFISTSWREGFGLPPIEAMGCGCAVITSNSMGVNEYAIPNTNCLMFAPKDVTELSQCIQTLIEDGTLRKKLSAEGQATAKKFNWDRSTKQLLDIISC